MIARSRGADAHRGAGRGLAVGGRAVRRRVSRDRVRRSALPARRGARQRAAVSPPAGGLAPVRRPAGKRLGRSRAGVRANDLRRGNADRRARRPGRRGGLRDRPDLLVGRPDRDPDRHGGSRSRPFDARRRSRSAGRDRVLPRAAPARRTRHAETAAALYADHRPHAQTAFWRERSAPEPQAPPRAPSTAIAELLRARVALAAGAAVRDTPCLVSDRIELQCASARQRTGARGCSSGQWPCSSR